MVCIDDVRFSYIPTCKTPSNVEVVSIPNDPTKMTLTWKANGAKSWAVRLFEVEYKRSTLESQMAFYDILKKHNIQVTLRKEQGHDINAACGQLRSQHL